MAERVSGWSLGRRLTLIATFAMVSSLAFGGLAIYWAASLEEDQMLDARLEHLGSTVLAFVEEELDEPDPSGAMKYHNVKTRPTAALLYRYQVWSRDGSLLLRSYEASSQAPLMSLGKLGYDTVHYQGDEYRAFALPTKDQKYVIQVAENIDERWSQNGLMTAYYMGFLLVPLALVFGVTWLLLRRSMHSVDAMASQLRHRNPLDLTPMRLADPPQELQPVLASIDTLFARVGHALSAERRFTSVAAHELRTPLAGLRAQAQLASTARDPAELQDALQSLQIGVDRASHMLEQLLDLAHIEAQPADGGVPLQRVVVSDVYQHVMTDIGPRCARKQIGCGARFAAETIECHEFALYVLLRNLLANAVLYSPVGGKIEVRSEVRDDGVALIVDDSGPGIPAQDRERAFERFNRLGQTKTEGVGLGLSIVLSVVELHHARVQLLDSPLGGLRVQVLFKATASNALYVQSQPVGALTT